MQVILLIDGYGTLQARLWASEAQIDQVIQQASDILHTNPRQSVTAEQRANLAVRIAAAKVNITDFGLEVTSKVYELQGARSISGKNGFDVAYRDLRTHSLHDPIAHKRAEVGRFALLGPREDGWPTPSWYT
jgi:alkylation response protein AidB-like acyl-CoA dehydrogenase